MSRVKGIVGNAIKVHIHDVVAGDILSISNDESDPIIEVIERDGEKVRFLYRERPKLQILTINKSFWLDPKKGEYVFIHDLKGERFEFEGA